MIARLVAIAIGVWLMFAPAVFEHSTAAADNARIAGPIAASFALVAAWEIMRPLRWAVVPVGAWLVVSPAVLGYTELWAAVNAIACGVVLVGTAFVKGRVTQRFGGGWRSLWA